MGLAAAGDALCSDVASTDFELVIVFPFGAA